MWKNNAQNIAYIGRMTRPELYKPLTIDFAGAIDDYYNTKNAAQQNRREEERLQAEKDARQQQADALMRWQSVIDKDETLSPIEKELYRQDMDAYSKYRQGQQDFSNTQELEKIRQQNALGLASYKNKLDMALAQMKSREGQEEQSQNDQYIDALVQSGQIPENEGALYKLASRGIKLPKGQNINVNNVNPFEKARVKRIAANADANIAKAESNLQDFNRARELLDTVPTGGISGYARSKMSPSLLSGDTAEFQSLVDKITPQMRPAGSGSTSDKDMEIFRNATIGLNKPKQTNLNIVKGRIAVEENNIAKEEIRAEMLNSGMSTSDFDKKWRQYLNDNPIFKNSKGDLNPNRVDAYSYFQGASSQDEDNSIENLKNKYNLR